MENSKDINMKHNVSIEMTQQGVVILPSDGKYNYCLVFLHGIGMEAQKLFNFFFSKEIFGIFKNTKVILPQAPMKSMTVSKGKMEYSWFDLKERNFDKPFKDNFNVDHIKESSERIVAILENEAKLLENDFSKIFLGGFSQGCALALHVGVPFQHKLGGIIALSGYLMEITGDMTVEQEIIYVHGEKDEVRPWKQVEPTLQKIRDLKHLQFIFYPDLKHDLHHEGVRNSVYSFFTNRTNKQ